MKHVLLILTALSVGLMSACTKSRDNKIGDETLEAELVTISELQADGYSMQLGKDAKMASSASSRAVNEKPSFGVTKINAPAKVSSLMTGLSVPGRQGEQAALKFIVQPERVLVYREVSNTADLSLLQQDVIKTIKGKNYLAMASIKVKAMGVLVRKKNEKGEQTTILELRGTDLSAATHVQLELNKDKVSIAGFGLDEKGEKTAREIFLADQLNEKLGTSEEIAGLLQTQFPGQNANQLMLVKVVPTSVAGSEKVDVLVFSVSKKSEIKDPKILAKLRTKVKTPEIQECSAEVKQTSGLGEDCILLARYNIAAKSVKAISKLDASGAANGQVELESVPASKRARLIQITENSVPATITPSERGSLNPIETIRVADIKGKEFFFRRTFEDAASTLSAFGPGASGPLLIVKFEMEESRLVVRRTDIVNGANKVSEIDREELMSIPARYFKNISANGFEFDAGAVVTPDEADIIVLDWTKNTLPVTNSPLSYIDNGSCFSSTGSQRVADMDMRLASEGVLNFSIEGSYAFREGCMSMFNMNDYWYGGNLQSVFNLRERVSFMLHDKSSDSFKNLNIPFQAQNLMGFGIFTMGKRVPDRFGNFGRTGNEIAMPIVQDFTNGKVMTYILGGLPADAELRKVFIDTTKQVVADWNEALRRSFKGSALERSGDYIDLKVDGVDIKEGHLGDLDRNYIWNFDKSLDSGLLGMSQDAPNPRSGVVVSNNVLMYSGNVMAQIGMGRQKARLLRQYEEMRSKAILALEKEMPAEAAEEKAAATENRSTEKSSETMDDAKKLLSKITSVARTQVRRMTPLRISQGGMKLALEANNTAKNSVSRNKTAIVNSVGQQKAFLHSIVMQAMQMNLLNNDAALEALTAAEVLKAYGPQLSEEERTALALQSRTMALRAEMQKAFSAGGTNSKAYGCMINGSAIPSIPNDELLERDANEIFSNWYAKTLSHEIGHSLGLTHNFKGSTDKRNFKFGDDEQDSHREYSSIMDYVPDEAINYSKPGPYDVDALRAGYTGLVELQTALQAIPAITATEENAKAAQVAAAQLVAGFNKRVEDSNSLVAQKGIKLVSGKYIHVDDLRKLIAPTTVDSQGNKVQTWWDVDARHFSSLVLKYRAFCTDVHVGGDPMCNRWDTGTTAQEVAKSYIRNYENYYPLYNARADRINAVTQSQYIGRMIQTFIPLRNFMDETFYKATTGQSFQDSAVAAIESYKLFLNVINTPETDKDVMDPARFIPVKGKSTITMFDEEGNPIRRNGALVKKQVALTVAEARATEDRMRNGHGDDFRVATRGIELDKVFSMMMLTQKSFGNPRYDSRGLRLSFADFEKYLLQMTTENSMLLKTLKGALNDNMLSTILTDEGSAVQLPPTMVPRINSLLRTYATLSATVFMESDAIEDKYNFASLFKVGSSLMSAPKDRPVVTKLDQNPNSRGALKLWAFDNASLTQEMVRDAAQKRILIENKAALMKVFDKMLSAKTKEELAAPTQELVAALESLNKKGVLLNEKEKASAGFDVQVSTIYQIYGQLSQQLVAMYKAAKDGGVPADQIAEALKEPLKNLEAQLETTTKTLPLLMIATEAMTVRFEKTPLAEVVKSIVFSEEEMRGHVGLMTSNLQSLNSMTIQMNPELNR